MNAQSDPFSSVRLNRRKEIVQEQPQQGMQEQAREEDPFSSVRIKKAEGFPWLYETGRHAVRIGSRFAEIIGGIPGDVSHLIRSGIFAGMDKLTGQNIGQELQESLEATSLPTSSKLKKMSIEKTKGLTAPQTPQEEAIDEAAETVASLLGPMKFRRALGIGIGAQAAKEGLKLAGVGEGVQEAGKLGTMFTLSMINPKGAMKYASSQYEKASQLAEGASVSAKELEKNLSNLQKDLSKGVTTSSKNVVLKPVEELLVKIQQESIPIDELMAAKRDLNTIMKDPAALTREKKLLKVVGKYVDDAIKPFEKVNPEFKNAYRPANEIYGAVMQGTKASDFITKTLGAKSFLGAVVGETILGHPEYILPTAGAAAGAIGLAKMADFMTRLAKSKELQKFYVKAMQAALVEDSSSLRMYNDKIEEFMNQKSSGSRSAK